MRRIFRTGFLNFTRNGIVSIASVLVMTITLSVLSGIMLFNHVLQNTLTSIENRVDVSVYFVPGADEKSILELKDQVATLPEVAETNYITEKQALENFRDRHANDQTTLQALDELQENPIGALVTIKAKEISQYGTIAKFFDENGTLSTGARSIIDHVDYNKNKDEIDAISGILKKSRLLGLILVSILIALSVIVTYNTVRLAIYFSREEISVMRLVGASKAHIQGPFIIEGVFYGLVAMIFTIIIFLPITAWMGSRMTDFLGLNLWSYYTSHILYFAAILFVFGAGLGALSSALAARRHLKI